MNEYTISYSAAEILDNVVKNIQTIFFYCIMFCVIFLVERLVYLY